MRIEKYKRMGLSEEFLDILKGIKKDEQYEYYVHASYAPTSLYNAKEDEIPAAHLNHITEDILEEDDYEIVASRSFLEGESAVKCEILTRRLKSTINDLRIRMDDATDDDIENHFGFGFFVNGGKYKIAFCRRTRKAYVDKTDSEAIISQTTEVLNKFSQEGKYKVHIIKSFVTKDVTSVLLLEKEEK